MKIKIFLLIPVIAVFAQCERTECCVNPNLELQGRFTHHIPNCDNSGNTEINCTEWLEFVNDQQVDILYGGGDIVYKFDYVRKDSNILYLEGEPTSSFKVSFKIVNSKTLLRLDTDNIWKKAE